MNGLARMIGTASILLSAGLVSACSTLEAPEGIVPVSGFEASRYMGTWYEIARMDYVFERGLDNVTATYSLNPDGTVTVLNRGYEDGTCELREREGRAEFVGESNIASLGVSFFGPFAGGYHVVRLDSQYRYAMVSGANRDLLWILSRTPTMDQRTLDGLLEEAAALGFDVTALTHVDQTGRAC